MCRRGLAIQPIRRRDADLNSAHKRIANLALEQMGMMTVQRLAIEIDARAHLGTGPRRMRFEQDLKEGGVKDALANRDGPFGDSIVKLRAPTLSGPCNEQQ